MQFHYYAIYLLVFSIILIGHLTHCPQYFTANRRIFSNFTDPSQSTHLTHIQLTCYILNVVFHSKSFIKIFILILKSSLFVIRQYFFYEIVK